METLQNVFCEITSLESLFDSWRLFRLGKSLRRDVQEFERNLEKNVFQLHRDLVGKKYKHAAYSSFFIQDPQVRHIRKACVRDRLVHQAIYTALVRIFEPQDFPTYESYSVAMTAYENHFNEVTGCGNREKEIGDLYWSGNFRVFGGGLHLEPGNLSSDFSFE